MSSIKTCEVCAAYRARRAHALAPHIARRAFIRGVTPEVVAIEFLFAVHRRHRSGLTLSTRPSTPDEDLGNGKHRIYVKRICNGCGTELGDATPEELEAAIDGRLPDVRLECGCLDRDGAAA